MSYWHPDPDYPGWYAKTPLSNGSTLMFSACDFDGDEVYDLEMVVMEDATLDHTDVSEGGDFDRIWAKEGQPVGPGGAEVFGMMPGLMAHMEYLIRKEGGDPIFRIGPATERLMKLYAHLLPRLGYTRVAGEMLKVLR